MKQDDWFPCGQCDSLHGVKGAFVLRPFSGQETTLHPQQKILLKSREGHHHLPLEGQTFTLTSVRKGNKVIATLEGVDSFEMATELLPFDFFIRPSDLPPLEDQWYYCRELIGLRLIEGETGRIEGEVVDTYSNGVQEVLVIKSYHEEDFELPFVAAYFGEIDLKKRVIYFKKPQIL